MGLLLLGGCGLLGGNKKHESSAGGKYSKFDDNNIELKKVKKIEIMDNVQSEIWKSHPMMGYMKANLESMALGINGFELEATDELKADARTFWEEFDSEYMMYIPNDEILKRMDSLLRTNGGNVKFWEIEIVGGNWCSDTRIGVPRLCKVLDELMHISEDNEVLGNGDIRVSGSRIKIVYRRVNREKKFIDEKDRTEHIYGRVPEINLFFKGDLANKGISELSGSIIETPMKTWEQDLLMLFAK